MAIFVCDNKDCPNVAVIYNFGEDSPSHAECGGCHAILEPKEEN